MGRETHSPEDVCCPTPPHILTHDNGHPWVQDWGVTLSSLFSLATANSQSRMLSLSRRVFCVGVSSQCQDSRGPDPGTGVFSLHVCRSACPSLGGGRWAPSSPHLSPCPGPSDPGPPSIPSDSEGPEVHAGPGHQQNHLQEDQALEPGRLQLPDQPHPEAGKRALASPPLTNPQPPPQPRKSPSALLYLRGS